MARNDPDVRFVGDFMAGKTAVLYFTFVDINGELFDPYNITITIYDPSGISVESAEDADKLEPGKYAHSWAIPATATPGVYSVKVDYEGEESSSFTEQFMIGEVESTTAAIDPKLIALRNLLETFLGYTQRIPVFNEIGRLNAAKSTADFSFGRWNQPSGVRVFVNGKLARMNYTINYLKGRVIFRDEVITPFILLWSNLPL